MIKLYIYRKSDGQFLYEDIGKTSEVIFDITDDVDFTLTEPPDYAHIWHWVDDKWTLID